MYVLVDYNNVNRNLRRKGVKFTIEVIAEKVCTSVGRPPKRMQFRLYGGWYDAKSLSRRAQTLAKELEGEFPFMYYPVDRDAKTGSPVRIQASLAYAMLIDPEYHLLHTFRRKKTYRSVRVQSPKTNGCVRDDCHLLGIKALFSKGKCPHLECSLTASDILSETRQQKLVDTMLTADFLHLSTRETTETIALVSSDDDFIPAVRQSLLTGVQVVHVHTGAHDITPSHYMPAGHTSYFQTTL